MIYEILFGLLEHGFSVCLILNSISLQLEKILFAHSMFLKPCKSDRNSSEFVRLRGFGRQPCKRGKLENCRAICGAINKGSGDIRSLFSDLK